MMAKGRNVMSSVSTALKVHYNQKLGDPSGHFFGKGDVPWPLGGIDAPGKGSTLSSANFTDGNILKQKAPTYNHIL